MIIKSHVRGGYRAAADYMKEQGKNEKTRLVELSDPSARNLDDSFHNMWVVAGKTKCTKPLHHISINPMKGEHLTDKQVQAIADRCEEAYGYKMFHHQRVIVEHVKDGRQHFHVIWNRVSLMTGSPVWPGLHWKKSKEVAREMEVKLGLKRPEPRQGKKPRTRKTTGGRPSGSMKGAKSTAARTPTLKRSTPTKPKGTKLAPVKTTREKKSSNPVAPIRPAAQKKGWPEAAIVDWEVWGHLFLRWFFVRWPELSNH
ncbi:MAG: hypothetical protein EOM37_01250 [Proteobacteria bacterium]|jgi:hypothetical protein|nr:hypothetical protein [Pseudomonadota bacterium]